MSKTSNQTRLNSDSSIGDIILAYGYASQEQVAYALEIRQSELDSITRRDIRAGRRARTLGEVLMDMAVVSMAQVRLCEKAQRNLKKKTA